MARITGTPPRSRPQHRGRVLRLHRQHHDRGTGDRGVVVSARADAEIPGHQRAGGRLALPDAQLLGAPAAAQQPADERASHVAGPEDA